MIEYFKQTIGKLNCILVADKNLMADAEQNLKPDGVVIFCHGYGAPGTDLVPLADALAKSNSDFEKVLFVFPEAPIELDPQFGARAWWNLDIEKIQELQAKGEFRELADSIPEGLDTCRNMLNELIESCHSTFSLATTKIVVGGFSQGAMLATDVALNYPTALGGLCIWSGNLIDQHGWTKAAVKQTSLKVFQSHGTTDPILPVSGAKLLHELLEVAGHSVDFVEFDGQHAIPPEAIQGAGRLLASIL